MKYNSNYSDRTSILLFYSKDEASSRQSCKIALINWKDELKLKGTKYCMLFVVGNDKWYC